MVGFDGAAAVRPKPTIFPPCDRDRICRRGKRSSGQPARSMAAYLRITAAKSFGSDVGTGRPAVPDRASWATAALGYRPLNRCRLVQPDWVDCEPAELRSQRRLRGKVRPGVDARVLRNNCDPRQTAALFKSEVTSAPSWLIRCRLGRTMRFRLTGSSRRQPASDSPHRPGNSLRSTLSDLPWASTRVRDPQVDSCIFLR